MVIIKKNRLIISGLIIAALLFFSHLIGILRPVENFLFYLTKPIAGRFYKTGTDLKIAYDESNTQENLNAKVERLTKEVAVLTVADSRSLEIEEENRKLREALKFVGNNNSRVVVASVIAKEAAAEDSLGLIINRGAKDGLAAGLAVVSEEGLIVGKVLETKDTTAKICLTTNRNCQLAAAIQNSNRTQGITDGDLGLTIKMNYIPQLEKITPGDIVITSGLGEHIARGLVIGRIATVYNESNEVWQSATIEPLVNLNNLTIVAVIIP
ncbi:MAG: rod shape-determining protein MreC [Candidatus Falkowbacteria bacterium]|nr:rod shape-determining protein MreC [Candidatus Falkowbacteria bacterium]